jgi:hypothetical protein
MAVYRIADGNGANRFRFGIVERQEHFRPLLPFRQEILIRSKSNMRQQIVITDANGRTANIEIQMERQIWAVLRRASGTEVPESVFNYHAQWRALSLGVFGAQSGDLTIMRGSGNEQIARAYNLELFAQLRRGVATRLLILKRWFTNSDLAYDGTGTLMHGVSFGMRAGEIAWSLTSIT